MSFTKKALIYPILKQIGSSALPKIKSRIKVNLATSLQPISWAQYFCVWERREKGHFCPKTRWKTFFGDEVFLRDFFALLSSK